MENLNVRIEKDPEGGWIAVLPPHPDMPDEEFGLPAESKEEAEAEARAYRAIEQSTMYKFDFDESQGVYVVRLGEDEFRASLLAEAYAHAQGAYARRINDEPPKQEEPPKPASQPVKRARGRPPTQKAQGNGEQQPAPKLKAPEPEPQPVAVKADDQKERLDKIEAILVVMARTILKEVKGESS